MKSPLQIALTSGVSFIALIGSAVNPYLPLWEYIPDGEPYVWEDPDNPGKLRVYVYGSHDIEVSAYCGRDQVVWSAPVEDLTDWRFDGVIFENLRDAEGKMLDEEGRGDVLYAPDVTLMVDADGQRYYYLYPNDQAGGRNGLVARSDRPDGPFHVINWNKDNPTETIGVMGFDPAVFVDDDGRVYGYWGWGESYAAELDPSTMATVKPGTEIVTPVVSGFQNDGVFRFYEASSIRKIEDKYVLVYSRMTADGEFGLPASNYTLAYAYSDNPLGPFNYGGTIIDGRGRHTLADGTTVATADPHGNTHGGICQINGQWWVFYHRQTGTNEFSRQAMVAPIEVKVEPGAGGKVFISEGEYNSEGFDTTGLKLRETYPAAIACHFTGPSGVGLQFPDHLFSGSHIHAGRIKGNPYEVPADIHMRISPVVNNVDGSIVGYKYFNFDDVCNLKSLTLWVELIPKGVEGRMEVYAGDPYDDSRQIALGEISLDSSEPEVLTIKSLPIVNFSGLHGKKGVYFKFISPVKGISLCDFYTLRFQ